MSHPPGAKAPAALPRWSRPLVRGAEGIAAVCAALALAGIMFLMLVDVTGRYLFNAPVPGAAEIIELAMGVTVFAALPLVTARDEHIRLDYFDHWLRGRLRPAVRALVELISAGVLGLIAWRLAEKSLTVMQYGDSTPFLRVPVAPVAWFITACAAVSTVIFLFHAWQQGRLLLVGSRHASGGNAS